MFDPQRMTVGTAVLPEVLVARGIAPDLQRMRELGGINTVMVFTHRHVGRQYRPGFAPLRDNEGNELTDVWVRTDPAAYDDPALQGKNPGARYADVDILDALHAEAPRHGMRVYARILEPYVITGAIPGFEAWREVNALGEATDHVCFNHPGYIRYWDSVVEDLLRGHTYLEGFKFGQERGGPLLGAMGRSAPGKCFCPHCLKLAEARGLDARNACEGLLAVHELSGRVRAGERLADGVWVEFLRLLTKYPAVMPWEQFWMESREAQRKRIFARIKALAPRCQVGWHMDHGVTWDLVTRATTHYAAMGPYTDWLSVALYVGSMGRRSRNHFDEYYRNGFFADSEAEDETYRLYLSMLGYNPAKQPPLEAHRTRDTQVHPEYVYAEARRVVRAVNGSAEVHARIGFDQPGYEMDVQPETVKSCVWKAIDAGVDGFWIGREWDELQETTIVAFGEALRERLA